MVAPRRKLQLDALDLRGRRLLLRTDLNAPIAKGAITDDTRIRAAIPAIHAAHRAGASVVVASHGGRPGGRVVPAMSLRPVAARLGERLGAPVRFREEPVGYGAVPGVPTLRPGETLLLENLRFHAGETANDPQFAARLAAFGDEYANDAFGAVHRAHASVDACARLFPRAAAGPLLEKELAALGAVFRDPPRPFVAVLGGAKVSDKLPVIRSLLSHADEVLIGGAMAYTFLVARDLPVGRSLVEPGQVGEAAALLRQDGHRIVLPTDHRVAAGPDAPAGEAIPVEQTPDDRMGLDIGPRSASAFAAAVRAAGTVVWNGPMGLFENPAFRAGTLSVAEAAAAATARGARTVVGGGDSAAAVRLAGVADRIGHLSTGGGASLAFLAGKRLPGVEALPDRPRQEGMG